ncbi:MAG: hypothetical protein ABI431_05080, partial [Candidatus Tumulicola sp.]
LRTHMRDHTGGPEMEVGGRLIEEYRHRIDVLRGKAQRDDDEAAVESQIDHRLQCLALEGERRAITRLRESGEIPDEIFRSIEYDLDLAALRLN